MTRFKIEYYVGWGHKGWNGQLTPDDNGKLTNQGHTHKSLAIIMSILQIWVDGHDWSHVRRSIGTIDKPLFISRSCHTLDIIISRSQHTGNCECNNYTENYIRIILILYSINRIYNIEKIWNISHSFSIPMLYLILLPMSGIFEQGIPLASPSSVNRAPHYTKKKH